jgi:hypothetical protein
MNTRLERDPNWMANLYIAFPVNVTDATLAKQADP